MGGEHYENFSIQHPHESSANACLSHSSLKKQAAMDQVKMKGFVREEEIKIAARICISIVT